MVLFVNDTTVSKGMVKYASGLTRESVIEVEGVLVVPKEPILSCTQQQVKTLTSNHSFKPYLQTLNYEP